MEDYIILNIVLQFFFFQGVDLLRYVQLSNSMKLLQMRFGHHKITLALGRCQTFYQGRYVMKVSKAVKIWLDYHQIHSKKKYG